MTALAVGAALAAALVIGLIVGFTVGERQGNEEREYLQAELEEAQREAAWSRNTTSFDRLGVTR